MRQNRFLASQLTTTDLATETTLKNLDSRFASGGLDVEVTGGDINIDSHSGWEVPTDNGPAQSGLQRAQRVCIANDNDDIPIKNGTSGAINVSTSTGSFPITLKDGAAEEEVDIGSGNAGPGTIRVYISDDQPQLDIRLNGINSSNIDVGSGTTGIQTQRVVLPTDLHSLKVYRESPTNVQTYVDYIETGGGSTNLAVNVASASDFTCNFTDSNIKYIDKIILCFRVDGGADIGAFADGQTLSNGFRLYYERNTGATRRYLSKTILINGDLACGADQYFHTTHGAGDDLIHVVYRYEIPIRIESTGEIGVEFLGADNYSSQLNDWSIAVHNHTD